MTPDHDDDLRQELRRRAESVTPRGTYADLEAKLAAAPHGAPRWQRPLLLSVAAVLALLLGAGVVALATEGSDEQQLTADQPPATTAPPVSLVDPPSTTAVAPPTTENTPDTAPPSSEVPTTTTTAPTTTTTPPKQPIGGDAKVTLYGIGSLQLPLDRAEVTAITGQELTGPSGDFPGSTCDFTRLLDGPAGVSFMTDGDRLVRVDVVEGDQQTVSGIGVGSTEAEVRATYPKAVFRPGKYSGTEAVVTDPSAPDYELLMQLDSGTVTAYRSGLAEFVEYVEGCA